MADTNPSEFWRTLETLKSFNDGKESHADNIPPDEWFDHLKALALKNIELNQKQKSLQDELAELEKTVDVDSQEILDKAVTIKEVKLIIKSLKKQKIIWK